VIIILITEEGREKEEKRRGKQFIYCLTELKGDLETRPKNVKSLWLGPYIYLFIGELYLAPSETVLLKKMLATSKKKLSGLIDIQFNRSRNIFENYYFLFGLKVVFIGF
jgi:hypothetical protein